MEFIFEDHYSFEDYLRFVKDHRKIRMRVWRVLFAIFMILVNLAYLGMAVLYTVSSGWDLHMIPYFLIVIAMDVLILLRPRFAAKNNVKRHKTSGESRTTINDSGIHAESKIGAENYGFGSIEDMFKNRENTLYVFISKRAAIIFKEEYIVSGDFGDFCYYLMQKTGKEIRAV